MHDVIGSLVATDAELRREARGVQPVTDDVPSIQYPHEDVRRNASYTTRLTLGPAHALGLLAEGAAAETRARVQDAQRATAAAIAALPAQRIEAQEASELALGRVLTPALHTRPGNGGLWALLALAPDRVRAAEAALREPGPPDVDAAWTLARQAFYAGDCARALERLAEILPHRDDRALHALLRAGCLRKLGRTHESAAAFREAAAASRDAGFRSAALELADHAAAPVRPEMGAWSLE